MGTAIPIAEMTFVVVDIETTGSVPGRDAITEIAAIRVQNGQITERFQQLVNPQQPIPPFIQELTGIRPDMVADAPTIDQVMPAFWDFLGDGVFVAHHVPFDFKFLNTVTKSLLGDELSNPQLCTCRLARKLLPTLKRKNLDSVSDHFGITIHDRHRALGDAEATAQILIAFLAMLEEEGITTMGRLMNYHQRGSKKYGSYKIPYPEHRISSVSQQPGVYLMRDDQGEILYIGKAKNLRKRLKSYFTGFQNQPAKVQELMQQVTDIETRILGSELEALLEEAHLIKAHQPYYNRQIKNYRTFPFLKITLQEPYPRLSVTYDIENDDALYFGPYQRKRHLATMVEALCKVFQLRACSDKVFHTHQNKGVPCMAYQIGTCTGPCASLISIEDYHAQVQEIVNFLEGRVSELTAKMIAKREAYSAEMAFEKAQQIHDRLLDLLKLQSNTRFLAQAVHQNHMLLALPDRDPPRSLLLYVYKGRPIQKQVFDPRTDDVDSITERVAMIQRMLSASAETKRDIIHQRELEEIRIIASWLRNPDRDDTVTMWDLTRPFSELTREIQAYVMQCQASLGDDWPVHPMALIDSQ